MKILFLSLSGFESISQKGIYTDLLRELMKKGHEVYAVTPIQRRNNAPTRLIEEDGAKILRARIGNITKVGVIEKGISTVMIAGQYKNAIKKFFKDTVFDVVLYPTPPITLCSVVEFIKKRDNAKSYLLLKDIFPQNAVDIGMMTKTGLKSVLYKMFRRKEEKLYEVSDFIGCMSEANREYLIKHNPELNPSKIHINPNCIEVEDIVKDKEKIKAVKEKYNIPENATTFIYGGNLGKPQGIPFIIKCLRANADKKDRFFIISGKGTEYPKLKAFVDAEKPSNVLLINGLPKDEYEVFVKSFDVGLIFLDHRFTIPNFPSRLLSYMQSSMPVLSCTDPNTDVGKVIEEGGFGWHCESNDVEAFTKTVDKAINSDIPQMGANGLSYLKENYTSGRGAEIICEYIEKKEEVVAK